MVQGVTYRNPKTRKYIAPSAVSDANQPTDPDDGEALEVFFEKMSKSKYNGVDPGAVVDRYGADTARMFILFKAPPEKDLEWDDADVEGQFRFLQRIWRLCDGAKASGLQLQSPLPLPAELTPAETDLRRAVHTAIEAVSDDLQGDELQFNTAVSELMKLSNAMGGQLEAVSLRPWPKRLCAACCCYWLHLHRTSLMSSGSSCKAAAAFINSAGPKWMPPRWCATRSRWCCR